MHLGWRARKDIAVHEAGHAVARVLSIGRVGITSENAIRWIEMDFGSPHCSVFELPTGMTGLKEFGERNGIKEGIWPTVEQWHMLFSYMGIDPTEWASVRIFEITAGAAAQAKFTGHPFKLVWHHEGCSDDRDKVIKTYDRIGLREPEAGRLLAEQSEKAVAAMDTPDVWRAVLTLADQLPVTGRIPGNAIVSIVQNALRISG